MSGLLHAELLRPITRGAKAQAAPYRLGGPYDPVTQGNGLGRRGYAEDTLTLNQVATGPQSRVRC